MPFNSTDFQKAPWQAGVMTLTHEECVHVLEACKKVEEGYNPAENFYDPVSDFYIQSRYNQIDWTKGINGETYAVLKGYDIEVHKLGINEQGIIYPEAIVEEEIAEEEEIDKTPQEEIVEENEEESPAE